MSRPRLALAVLALAGAILTSACGGRERVLHVLWPGDVPSLDPNERFDFTSDTIASNVFEPLVRYDRQMAFTPCLARSWEILPDATWRFHLREGVAFHDGTKLTAEDVSYSIRRLQGRPERDIHRYVSAITDVRIVDSLTVEVRSKRPAGVLSVLSFVYVLPRRSVERLGEDAFFRTPSGTGPYRVAAWKRGEELRLEAHPGYWGGVPQVPAAVFRVVKSDDGMWKEARRLAPAVVLSPSTSTWKRHTDDPGFQLIERPGLAVHFLSLRISGGPANPLSDLRVRRALHAAIDYGRLISSLPAEGAFPASQFVPPAIVGFNPTLTVPPYVPGAARRLLQEAGLSQKEPLVFLTLKDGGPVSRFLIDSFVAAGLKVREDAVEAEEFERRATACEADIFLTGWICSTGDAGELFEGNFSRGSSVAHPCGYGSDEMDAAIEAIGATLDPAARRDLLQAAMKRLVDDLPWIPLLVSYDRHATTPGVEWQTRADGQLDLRDVRLR